VLLVVTLGVLLVVTLGVLLVVAVALGVGSGALCDMLGVGLGD